MNISSKCYIKASGSSPIYETGEGTDTLDRNGEHTAIKKPCELFTAQTKRRRSLDVATNLCVYDSRCTRRSSVGTLYASSYAVRRSSLGEEVLRLNLLRQSYSALPNSISGHNFYLGDSIHYDPQRRSSLGSESLQEHDVEDEDDTIDQNDDLLSEPFLELQYADDVFAVKRSLEQGYHPRNCLIDQPQIIEPMRCTLVNWLGKVNKELCFGSETLFLAVNLFDRFLASSAIASDCLQLLAISSLFVAAKMEERKVPSISGLMVLCSAIYRPHHFRRMEILLLTKLGFKLHAPTSWYFINYLILKASHFDDLDRSASRIARRVAETSLCCYDINQYQPSIQAAASLLYAVTALTCSSDQLEEYCIDPISDLFLSYEECNIQNCRDESKSTQTNEYSNQSAYTTNFSTCNASTNIGVSDDEGSRWNSCADCLEESSTPEDNLLTLIQKLFSRAELLEIVVCSEYLKNHFASFESSFVKEARRSLEGKILASTPATASGARNSVLASNSSSDCYTTAICYGGASSDIGQVCSGKNHIIESTEDLTELNLRRRDSGISAVDIDNHVLRVNDCTELSINECENDTRY